MDNIQKAMKSEDGGFEAKGVEQDAMMEEVFADNPDFVLENIDQILEDLPEVDDQLDEAGLQKLCKKFEKHLSKNQQLRAKYPDKPNLFMESELDLDEDIRKFNEISLNLQLLKPFMESSVRSNSW